MTQIPKRPISSVVADVSWRRDKRAGKIGFEGGPLSDDLVDDTDTEDPV